MKYLPLLLAPLLALAVPAHAGTPDEKSVIQPAATSEGAGFYIAPEGGFNLYHVTPDAGRPGIGNEKVDLGGYVGGKLGYTFRTGPVLPTFETDMFYNRFGGAWDRVYRGPERNHVKHRESEDYQIDSGAFLENALLRFDFGTFQPYIGAGIGAYTQSSARQQTDRNYDTGAKYSYDDYHRQTASWAWQLVAGADYFVRQNISLFVEYKYLNYMDTAPHDRLSQQLLGSGVRFYF